MSTRPLNVPKFGVPVDCKAWCVVSVIFALPLFLYSSFSFSFSLHILYVFPFSFPIVFLFLSSSSCAMVQFVSSLTLSRLHHVTLSVTFPLVHSTANQVVKCHLTLLIMLKYNHIPQVNKIFPCSTHSFIFMDPYFNFSCFLVTFYFHPLYCFNIFFLNKMDDNLVKVSLKDVKELRE